MQLLPSSGLQGDLELHMNATFTYEDGEITIFAEKEVDMSAKKDEPEVPVYPLGDGNIVLTVYNNSFDIEAADDPVFPYLKILAHETIPESAFTEFTLPEPFDPDSDDFDGEYEFIFKLPRLGSDSVSPFLFAVTVQLLALQQTKIRGIAPDVSNVLNKITVTK